MTAAPTYTVTTPYGDVEVVLLDSNQAVSSAQGWRGNPPLMLNGVPYDYRSDFTHGPVVGWKPSNLTLHKSDGWGKAARPTESAINKGLDVQRIIQRWLACNGDLEAAHRASLDRNIAQARENVNQAKINLVECERVLSDLVFERARARA